MLVLEKKAFHGINKNELTEEEINRIITSKMFLKIKYKVMKVSIN